MSSHDPRLVGRGGGFGKHKGLSISEIEDRFAACLKDPSMRSVSAILRITREQVEARGQLGSYPWLALGFTVVAAILAVVERYLPESPRRTLLPATIGIAVIAPLLLFGALTTRRERQENVAQEKEIRRLAAESLVAVLQSDFSRKPLTREHADTLKDIMKQEPGKPELRSLLEEV